MDLLKNFGLLAASVVVAGIGLYLGSADEAYAGLDVAAFLFAGLMFCAQVILVDTRKGVLATALFAAGCNAYLLYGKFDGLGQSACDINAKWSCSAVNALPESEIAGIPITLLGLGFFLGLALASLGVRERTPHFDRLNLIFAVVNLFYSAFLGFVAIQAGLRCVMCFSIYGANILLLIAGIKGVYESGKPFSNGLDKVFGTRSLWVITGTFALTVLVGTSAWRNQRDASEVTVPTRTDDGQQPSAAEYRSLYVATKGTIELDGTEPILGDPSAPITIVEYADYACPHCAQAAPMMKAIISEHREARLMFKAFPLSGACNPVIPGEEGVEKCKAAMAGECAGEQGRYFEMSSMMFANIGNNSDDALAAMAGDIDIDFDRWLGCMGEQATIMAVIEDAKAGAKAMVQGTPTLFVKGLVGDEWVEMTQGPPGLKALLDGRRQGVEFQAP